jgi:nucleotide-binding universal stress UspA family protein
MYKRIAVAVDGSDTSAAAVSEAIKLAKLMDSTLLLLFVCEEMPVVWNIEGMTSFPVEDMSKALIESGRRLLQKDETTVTQAGIKVETRLVEDYQARVGTVISKEAAQWKADLLVVGTHGRKGIDHLLMGSVAEGVMRTANMPVLLVRGA